MSIEVSAREFRLSNGHQVTVNLVRGLPDRRPTPSDADYTSAHDGVWLVQAQVEHVLYGNKASTGAMQKLIKRTEHPAGVPPRFVFRSRRIAVDEEKLLTSEEWEALSPALHEEYRSFTMIPRALVLASIEVLGSAFCPGKPHSLLSGTERG